ncbi:allantoinase [Robertmurraya kyonggiensis]|uniref:Allantoinase n=1 Tax=Robertmurraya kyonggiensis TaxID=1037680 RepID=A0A4U1D4Q2_9BACI|nr:allantoinase [Robertmurraya kyonggiensis]TKC16106.1 allantoinase [Robertmurraya kyonggiensis]
MPDYDLIIRNGFVVLPEEVKKADIGIKDGVIVKIESEIAGIAKEERDETGNYLFPGMIDVHVHFNDPGRDTWEGFETGSEMMAAAGCTTFFDMPLNGIPSTIDKEALFQKVEKGKEKSIVDFALWGGLVPGNEENLEELSEAGVIGFKAFLSESGNEEFERVDDMTLLRGMKEIAFLGKILALHSESDAMTKWLAAQKREKGLFTADDYLETRPILAEVEAVERVLSYAKLTGCSIHFVHISSAAAVEKIEEAKKQGLDVTVETCPHYLLFNHDVLIEKGAIAKCAPPLREKSEQEKLVQLILDGKFDMVASDHSPSPYSMKDPNIHHLFNAWGGISGGQFTLLSMIELAVKHDFPFSKIALMTATNPAERFGLSTKGKIELGYDADLAIVSLAENFTATEENFFAKHKQSIYLGHTFPSKVKTTICRGNVVYENDKIMKHNGEWLSASHAQQIRI